MTKADRLAILLKSTINQLTFIPAGILLGRDEKEVLLANQEPCDPPDYNEGENTFCGVPIVWVDECSRFSVILDIPRGWSLSEAYEIVLGGCIAISPDMYQVALRDIARLCFRTVDDEFIAEVKEHEKSLPQYED